VLHRSYPNSRISRRAMTSVLARKSHAGRAARQQD
jgi:hypothetical protein